MKIIFIFIALKKRKIQNYEQLLPCSKTSSCWVQLISWYSLTRAIKFCSCWKLEFLSYHSGSIIPFRCLLVAYFWGRLDDKSIARVFLIFLKMEIIWKNLPFQDLPKLTKTLVRNDRKNGVYPLDSSHITWN